MPPPRSVPLSTRRPCSLADLSSLGFRVSGFRVSGLGFQGVGGLRVQVWEFTLGFWIGGVRFQVQALGCYGRIRLSLESNALMARLCCGSDAPKHLQVPTPYTLNPETPNILPATRGSKTGVRAYHVRGFEGFREVRITGCSLGLRVCRP